MRRPVVTLWTLIVSTIVCLSVGAPDSLARVVARAPANPRGVADPRGVYDPRGRYDPR
jgi:hypothetical protein